MEPSNVQISQLTQHLLDVAANYSVVARPDYYTKVFISFVLIKTLSLGNSGVLDIVAAVNLTWTDKRLSWSPNDYGNISIMQVPSNLVWTPSLMLSNAGSANFLVIADEFILVEVSYLGRVNFVVQRQYSSICNVNLERFPFDTQICSLVFTSSSFANLTTFAVYFEEDPALPDGVQLGMYSRTGEFILLNSSMEASGQNANLCTGGSCVPSVTLTIAYKRQSSFYLLNMIVPACLLTLILPFAFIIPSDNGAKVTMTCSLMIALYVLQQNVSRLLPATASSSLCALGSVLSLIIGCFSLIGTIILLNFRIKAPVISPFCLKIAKKFFWSRFLELDDPHAVQTVRNLRLAPLNDAGNLQPGEPSVVLHQSDPVAQILGKIAATIEEQVRVQHGEMLRVTRNAEKSRDWTMLDSFLSAMILLSFFVAALVTMLVLDFQL